jgi:cytochrome c oxidase subunit 2
MLMGLAAIGAQPAFAQATTIPQTVTPHPGAVTPSPTPPVVAGKPGDIVHIAPTPGMGMPSEKIGQQPQVTPIGDEARWFHDDVLVPMMALISIFVLILLILVIVRYNARANPVPSQTHHNTAIEIIWTLVPVIILVLIAVPSIRLLAHQYPPPKADLTVLAIGNLW